MKTPTVIRSRAFLLALAIGSARVTPALFGGTTPPGVPPWAVALGLKAPPPPLLVLGFQRRAATVHTSDAAASQHH